VVVVSFVSQSASLGWFFFIQVWVFLLWFNLAARARDPFRSKLDQLLVLLLPQAETDRRGALPFRPGAIQALRTEGSLGRLRGSARRWRTPLRALYAQGYQVASETISSPADITHSSELLQETVAALKAERASGGTKLATTEDPVVVLAYGLGAWPEGADLTSLEQLLGELSVTHAALRSRFESLIRTIATANQNRDFRELAGASFVLGASARIIEATSPPGRSVPPTGWLAALKTYRR